MRKKHPVCANDKVSQEFAKHVFVQNTMLNQIFSLQELEREGVSGMEEKASEEVQCIFVCTGVWWGQIQLDDNLL